MTNPAWTPINDRQVRALARIVNRKKDPVASLVVARDRETGVLVAVPASNADRRRWDISRGGKVTRVAR